MDRGSLARPVVQRWRATVGLAVLSLLPELLWRFLPDLTATIANALDLIVVGAIVTPSVVGSPRLGLTFAWLLVGYLTYQYTPYLYPDEFAAVVNYRGFRLLTTLGILYFGLVIWGSAVTEAVPLQVLPISSEPTGADIGLMIVSLLAGLIGGGIAFGIYFSWWHPEDLYSEQSDLTALFDPFFDEDDEIEADALPDRWAAVYRWQERWVEMVLYSILPTVICTLVGLVGILLNLFYPLPEAGLVIGLVALRTAETTGLTSRRAPTHEVDLRLLDSISGATRNIKGTLMLIVAFVAAIWSAIIFAVLLSALMGALSSSGGDGAASGSVPVWLAGLVVVTMVVSLLLVGVYSLVHWVRQLERLEPYSLLWEGDESELTAGEPADETAPTRPPGFLTPAHLPIVGLFAAASLLENGFPVIGSSMGVALFASAIVVMGWGLVRTWRGEPQPLARESRDLTATIVGQFGITLLLVINPSTLELQVDLAIIAIFGLGWVLLIGGMYMPEVMDWQSRQQGTRRLLGDIPLLLWLLGLVGLARFGFEGSTVLFEAILLLLATIIVFFTVLNIYLERLSR